MSPNGRNAPLVSERLCQLTKTTEHMIEILKSIIESDACASAVDLSNLRTLYSSKKTADDNAFLRRAKIGRSIQKAYTHFKSDAFKQQCEDAGIGRVGIDDFAIALTGKGKSDFHQHRKLGVFNETELKQFLRFANANAISRKQSALYKYYNDVAKDRLKFVTENDIDLTDEQTLSALVTAFPSLVQNETLEDYASNGRTSSAVSGGSGEGSGESSGESTDVFSGTRTIDLSISELQQMANKIDIGGVVQIVSQSGDVLISIFSTDRYMQNNYTTSDIEQEHANAMVLRALTTA